MDNTPTPKRIERHNPIFKEEEYFYFGFVRRWGNGNIKISEGEHPYIAEDNSEEHF